MQLSKKADPMIDRRRYNHIRGKHGHYASWAVWAEGGHKPKDRIGDLSVLDVDRNPGILRQLKPGIVLVGLNISREITTPLANFHDARPQAMDFKIRHALKNTPLWGAYMTDVIKGYEQKVSGKMMAYLRANPQFERDNIRKFRRELADLGAGSPILVAFGGDAHRILSRNFAGEYEIFRLPHYSNYCDKEKYREQVTCVLKMMNKAIS